MSICGTCLHVKSATCIACFNAKTNKTMSEIQWTDETWNPWQGCTKVSAGCANCYMYRHQARFGKRGSLVYKSKPPTFKKPLDIGGNKRIFTCSLSDFFHPEADAWRTAAWRIIRKTPHHTYQILTKRPERITECLPSDWGEHGYANVWLGVSAGTHKEAFHQTQTLAKIPAQVRFLSAEPLLEDIFRSVTLLQTINNHFHWVILGGESGFEKGTHRYRPSQVEWYERAILALSYTRTPVFVKQLGTYLAKNDLKHLKLGWKGDAFERFPGELQIRQFPQTHVEHQSVEK